MNERIVGVLKDISQFIIGTLVEETETTIVLKRALLTTVEKDPTNPGVIPRFFPMSLLTVEPPFHVMSFLKEPGSIDFPITLHKSNILTGVLEVSDQMKEVYLRNFVGVPGTMSDAPKPESSNIPAKDIIKLY